MTIKQIISNFHREESGQDMLEYALVLAAVLAAVVAGSTTLSSTIDTELDEDHQQHHISIHTINARRRRVAYPCGTAPLFSFSARGWDLTCGGKN